jgi:hypothetical protein
MGMAVWLGVLFFNQSVMGGPNVDLGAASGFSILAGSGITVAGAVNSTTISGDIGTFPTTSITGLGNVVLNGTNQAGGSATQNAKTDLLNAFNDAAGFSANVSYSPIFDLGGKTLMPGVYNDPSSFGITGTLTLNGNGNPDAVWIFQAASTLTTASSSHVILEDGAQASNVFWEIGSSATIGTDTNFVGSILSDQSITLDTGASVDGRLLALNGAVTLDNNLVTLPIAKENGGGGTSVPDSGSTILLLGSGLVATLIFRGRSFFGA